MNNWTELKEFLESLLKAEERLKKRLELIEEVYFEKLGLVKKFIRDWGEKDYNKLKKFMRSVKRGISRDEKEDENIKQALWQIILKIDSVLKSHNIPDDFRMRLYLIRQRLVDERDFIIKLNQVLRSQSGYFHENNTWDEGEHAKKLLDSIYEEGRLLGWKKASNRRIASANDLTKDIIKYENLRLNSFEEIVSESLNIGQIRGSLYAKKGVSNFKAGIVTAHGIYGTRKGLEVFSKRLAMLGFLVYAFDMPGHVLDEANKNGAGDLNYGMISEYILHSVQILATIDAKVVLSTENGKFRIAISDAGRKIRKVGVVGHSLGAAGAAFACYNYTVQIEKIVESLGTEESKTRLSIFDLLTNLNKTSIISEREEIENELEKRYKDIEGSYKKIRLEIFQSLKNNRFNNAGIDAIVLASPPTTLKILPTPLLKTLKMIPNRILKPMTKNLVLDQKGKLVDYLINVKNPADYLGLIWFFSKPRGEHVKIVNAEIMRRFKGPKSEIEKIRGNAIKDEPITDFIRAYKKRVIDPIPKLLVYGSLDYLTGAMFERGRKKIEDVYSLSGNLTTKLIYGKSHFLNPKWQIDSPDGLKSDKASKIIIDFLETTLAGKY